jgi:hypothetical protein
LSHRGRHEFRGLGCWTSRFADAPPLLSSEIQRRAHEVALAELDPAMAQDVIRRCAVEIEVRQDEILQQPLPRELALVGAELDCDVLVLGAVDLSRLEGFAVVDRLGEARLELGETCFRVGHVRHLGAGKRATTPGGVRARLLHLPAYGYMSGKSRMLRKKLGSSCFASICAIALSIHSDWAVRNCTKIGTDTLYMETVME